MPALDVAINITNATKVISDVADAFGTNIGQSVISNLRPVLDKLGIELGESINAVSQALVASPVEETVDSWVKVAVEGAKMSMTSWKQQSEKFMKQYHNAWAITNRKAKILGIKSEKEKYEMFKKLQDASLAKVKEIHSKMEKTVKDFTEASVEANRDAKYENEEIINESMLDWKEWAEDVGDATDKLGKGLVAKIGGALKGLTGGIKPFKDQLWKLEGGVIGAIAAYGGFEVAKQVIGDLADTQHKLNKATAAMAKSGEAAKKEFKDLTVAGNELHASHLTIERAAIDDYMIEMRRLGIQDTQTIKELTSVFVELDQLGRPATDAVRDSLGRISLAGKLTQKDIRSLAGSLTYLAPAMQTAVTGVITDALESNSKITEKWKGHLTEIGPKFAAVAQSLQNTGMSAEGVSGLIKGFIEPTEGFRKMIGAAGMDFNEMQNMIATGNIGPAFEKIQKNAGKFSQFMAENSQFAGELAEKFGLTEEQLTNIAGMKGATAAEIEARAKAFDAENALRDKAQKATNNFSDQLKEFTAWFGAFWAKLATEGGVMDFLTNAMKWVNRQTWLKYAILGIGAIVGIVSVLAGLAGAILALNAALGILPIILGGSLMTIGSTLLSGFSLIWTAGNAAFAAVWAAAPYILAAGLGLLVGLVLAKIISLIPGLRNILGVSKDFSMTAAVKEFNISDLKDYVMGNEPGTSTTIAAQARPVTPTPVAPLPTGTAESTAEDLKVQNDKIDATTSAVNSLGGGSTIRELVTEMREIKTALTTPVPNSARAEAAAYDYQYGPMK